jgi:hypothetical protein
MMSPSHAFKKRTPSRRERVEQVLDELVCGLVNAGTPTRKAKPPNPNFTASSAIR